MRVTLTDVARAAGVSVSLASRVLAGKGEAATATRERVRRVARELGYRRDGEPRGRPRSRAGGMIDLALGFFDDAWSLEALEGARVAALARGFDLVLTAEREDPADDWPERARHRPTLGVVAGLIGPSPAQASALADAGIPLVQLDPRGRPVPGLPMVSCANEAAGRAVGAHLRACGYERLVVVTGAPEYRYGRERLAGFRDAVGPGVRVVPAGWSPAAARDAVGRVLGEEARRGRVGIFAMNDGLAAGVVRACADLGLDVPGEVGVVGFDDVPGRRPAALPLTSVQQPIRAMAARATHLLADLIDGRPVPAARLDLPARLVARDTTASAT